MADPQPPRPPQPMLHSDTLTAHRERCLRIRFCLVPPFWHEFGTKIKRAMLGPPPRYTTRKWQKPIYVKLFLEYEVIMAEMEAVG